MNNVLLLLILLFCIVQSSASNSKHPSLPGSSVRDDRRHSDDHSIDSIKSPGDVNAFLARVDKKRWSNRTVFFADTSDTSTFGKNKFFKLDLDGNGRTDLVVNGVYLLAVTDMGGGRYGSEILNYYYPADSSVLKEIIYRKGRPLLVVHGEDTAANQAVVYPRLDTLTFIHGGFMEYNPKPKRVRISEVSFEASGCFGNCPSFKLSITADRKATYLARMYNPVQGSFAARLDPSVFELLLETMTYAKIEQLKEDYAVEPSDNPIAYLRVKFSNGRVKHIRDYGQRGTFGLRNVYRQLFDLRTTQKWQ